MVIESLEEKIEEFTKDINSGVKPKPKGDLGDQFIEENERKLYESFGKCGVKYTPSKY